MTFVAPESAPGNAARIPSIIVLGADALLAALPATPVQLAHACALAGYQTVIPASWGDELIAAASLRAVSQHGHTPAIQCSCPYVAHRLLAVGTDLRPFLLSLVAPPVVLARYLRAAYGSGKLRITYVGRCPGAADESIDARLTPEELLAMFTDRQIAVEAQPEVYDSVIPPDRRRYRSQPGGLPTAEMLWSATSDGAQGPRTLVELYGEDLPVELAQHLLAGKPVLIDCAPKLGCVCSGATAGADPVEARARVVALEPPRAPSPVVDEQLIIDATLPLPASPRSAIDIVAPPPGPAGHVEEIASPDASARVARREETLAHGTTSPATEQPRGALATTASRRPSPARGVARPAAGALPTTRDAGGRQLPRTYVAHRRLPTRTPRSVPIVDAAPSPSTEPAESAQPNTEPNESRLATELSESRAGSPHIEATSPPIVAPPAPVRAPLESATAPDSMTVTRPASPTVPNAQEPRPEPPRFAERAVTLPVTPRSDGAPRHEAAPQAPGERPLMQLLTLGLLIAMIALVSAVVGVLVGRWLTQH